MLPFAIDASLRPSPFLEGTLRALPLVSLRFELTLGLTRQAASMILLTAARVKDMDESFQIQTANSPLHDTPKTECIRTLHQVDGNRCMLSHLASPPFLTRTLSLSLACARERVYS
jgi:hypothetical protein